MSLPAFLRLRRPVVGSSSLARHQSVSMMEQENSNLQMVFLYLRFNFANWGLHGSSVATYLHRSTRPRSCFVYNRLYPRAQMVRERYHSAAFAVVTRKLWIFRAA